MTSCLLVKAPDRIVVVADGRISVSSEKRQLVSLDTAVKIIGFTPTYRIPQIDRGRFVRYSDRTSADWCIAYAGNVALANEILRQFISRVTKGLFLTWTDGKATLKDVFDESAQFGADYEFGNRDLIPLTPDTLAEQLRHIAKLKCDEFALNRGAFPDCEFLLFGRDEVTKLWRAFKLYANDAGWEPGCTASLILDEIGDGALAAIGSRPVAGEAYADQALIAGLQGWTLNQSAIELDAFLSEFNLDDPSLNPSPHVTHVHDPQNWGLFEVKARLREHIQAAPDTAVGGSMTIASGGDYGEIELCAE